MPSSKRIRIASQACERCRARRSKCDEQRPQCGRCRSQNAVCVYGESSSTRLEQVGQKVSDISETLEELKDRFALFLSTSNTPSVPPPSTSSSERLSESAYRPITHTQEELGEILTVPHRVLLWPCIYDFLIRSNPEVASDLELISQEGTKWFVRREMTKHPHSLPSDAAPPLSSPSTLDRPHTDGTTELNMERMLEYTNAYFRSFNVLLPILDYDVFVQTVLEKLAQGGIPEGDVDVVLALFVFALGQLAAEGMFGEPLNARGGISSGFRGGDAERPPGLYVFNQARRRLGFIDCLCTLQNVQIYILQATYYGANGHYLEYCKSISAASTTIRVLLKSHDFEWSSPMGDMISRAYWTCLFQENLYHVDLDLPPTGIQKYEDEVPLPLFSAQAAGRSTSPGVDEDKSHFKHHFLAMIALQRLIVRIHSTIHERTTRAESSNEWAGVPAALIREMTRQLDSWRSLLPKVMQWSDDGPLQYRDAELSNPQQVSTLFTRSGSSSQAGQEHSMDMLTAQLRTRYYYARYLLYRPYVYKALHYPEQMSSVDAKFCATALYSMCLWPSLMAPPKSTKRLVPHLYAWTQNFLGMLLIFNTIRSHDYMRRICQERVGEERIHETVTLMLEWMRDAKQVDGTAEWGWKIVAPIFPSDDVPSN